MKNSKLKATNAVKKAKSKISFGTIRIGNAKPLPLMKAKAVFKLKKRRVPVLIARPVLFQDGVDFIKFKLTTTPEGALKIKVGTNNAQKFFITKTNNEKKSWCLTSPPANGDSDEDYDRTFHKTPFAAYQTGLRDIWDVAAH